MAGVDYTGLPRGPREVKCPVEYDVCQTGTPVSLQWKTGSDLRTARVDPPDHWVSPTGAVPLGGTTREPFRVPRASTFVETLCERRLTETFRVTRPGT